MSRPAGEHTLADYVVVALSPALIMALVGSLVFFLAELLYVGQYGDSLRWVLFFFVFGAVLVARVSMSAGIADRAGLYGAVLALVSWFALQRFVEYPGEGGGQTSPHRAGWPHRHASEWCEIISGLVGNLRLD
jgi:hypothetical protein